MRRASKIGFLCATTGLLLVSLLTLGSCGRPDDDPTSRLLRQLPPDQALYLYLDFGRVRNSPSLEPLLHHAMAGSAEVADIAEAAGLNLPADIDLAAVSLGAKGTHLAVRGRFHEAKVKWALESAGAECSESLRSGPCNVKASGSRPEISLMLRAADLLRVSIGSDLESAGPPVIEGQLQKLVVQARERLDHGAVLWATFDPARADQTPGSESLTNLRFFARALEKADRGFFYVDALPDGKMQLTLKANCADSRQAVSVSNVLTGLNRLAAAALEAGRGEESPPEVRVLRGARIVNTETTVVAVWVVDESILRAWGGA